MNPYRLSQLEALFVAIGVFFIVIIIGSAL
jgi:hypothetical protein